MNAPSTGSAYTTQLRLLLCTNCGAPVDVSVMGGSFQCRYCSAQSQLAARSALPAFAPHQASQIPEEERMRRLRMQDNRPLLPPQGIAHLFGPGGEIPPWREQEVFAAWQAARKRTATQAVDAAEELFFLTEALGNKFVHTKDWTKHRAMLESALEAVFLPRHRSILAANLCLGACRQGDVDGATTWLTLADPASDDLYADSMYRMARARVCALKGDYQGVISALGQSAADLPIHDALDCSASVHRANAWERLGRVDLAVQGLQAEMAKSPQNRASVETIVGLYNLCGQSFPQASGAIQQQSATVAASMASGGIDKIFVPLGKVMIGVGAFFLIAAIVSVVASIIGAITGLEVLTAIGGTFGLGGGITGVTLLGMGVMFFMIGKTMRDQAEKARHLALHGKRARGTVMSIQPTGMSINDVPQMVLKLRVELDGAAPYEAEMKMLIPPHQVAQLAGGATIALRVDPNNPREIAAEA
jgi:hypothetical protein